ncbi:MAG: hypothetical protein ABSG21_07615 [Spirochaetia bacterium]|jgi:hypothetical protein
MKRKLSIIALITAAAVTAGAQVVHVAPFGQGDVDLQSRAQLVANIGSWDVLAELLGRLDGLDTPLHSFESVTVGGYYRVIPNLKVGALYRVQAGARHDDDVIPNTSTQQGVWNDTSQRLESILMLDVSPRFQLGFLPGSNWVLMLKGRYLYNAWNGQMSVMARPELTWFWIQDRDPFLNISLSYEMYFPLNFGTTFVYQSYPYLTVLWHAGPEIGVEISGAYMTTVWSTSTSWAAQGWGSYSTPINSWKFSLGIVYTPSF